MPRQPKPHWSERDGCYKTSAGGRTKYFRGIARNEHARIGAAFEAYLAELDAAARPPEPTADDLCLAFLKAGRGIKPRTLRTHKERLLKWCEWEPADGKGIVGGRRAGELRAKDLRNALRAWEGAGHSDHYRAGICRSVKAAWAWAASEEGGHLIAANPFAEVRGPTIEHAPERYAERSEVAAFLRFAWRRAGSSPGIYRRFGRLLVLLMRVAAHTGARPGELAAAWWDDFDPARGTITLPPDRHKTGSKTGQPRTFYLSSRAVVRAILRWKGRPDRHPVSIFVHKRGKGGIDRGAGRESGEPWGKFVTLPGGRSSFEPDTGPLCKAIRKLRAEAVAEAARRRAAHERLWGLDTIKDEGDDRFVLYKLRHTKASDDLMSGGNPATVAKLLGTSVRMLETTYSHLLGDHLADAAADLAARRRRKPGG